MGVGIFEDLVICIGLGVDMFDCVMLICYGCNGMVFIRDGNLVIKYCVYIDFNIFLDLECCCFICW